jgi:acyl transferase domain-containing protein/3-hydroxymyristoyl/3-hydroxydecanoyl-(acyl carrier protein) dehydratase
MEPVAVIGRACLLPGAHNPEQLWDAVVRGENLLTRAPAGRWGIEPELVMCPPGELVADRTWTDRGGYVRGFEDAFDPDGFQLSADEIATLDPLYRWTLHVGREALRDAGDPTTVGAGAIIGNLSYPTTSLVALAEATWLERLPGYGPEVIELLDLSKPAAVNRFMSGFPVALLAEALALGAGGFALDAACASSLYAIKLACDWLASGRAEVMLAGGVCCADSLLLHQGFAALNALSHSGESRPFHRAADGLLPAEGCALVVLKRLPDAIAAGDRIRGVIRGIGLSNDGRGKGLLVPDAEGQRRAIERAYASSGVDPASVSLLECHATGTRVGDAIEVESLAAVFGDGSAPPVGSLKSNLGHLMTAAGVAGLIKVLEAVRAGIRPPSLHADSPIPELARHGVRLLDAPEPWTAPTPRRAAVSAFGFGGNNAHLVLEGPEGAPARTSIRGADLPPLEVAIVGLGVQVGGLSGRARFLEALVGDGVSEPGPITQVVIDLEGSGIAPNDLRVALGQHTLALAAAAEAVGEVDHVPWSRTGVLIGIETDPDATRWGLRSHVAEWGRRLNESEEWVRRARDGVVAPAESAAVLGSMPNMPANRINRRYDARGFGFTISAGEMSGPAALDVAAHALRTRELDAAVIGAADLSGDVHAAVADEILGPVGPPGDAVVVMVLKRLQDAEAAGDRVYAVLGGDGNGDGLRLGSELGPDSLEARFGHAYAAAGLLRLAVAALCLHHRMLPDRRPWLAAAPRVARVSVASGKREGSWGLTEHERTLRRAEEPGHRFFVYGGVDAVEVLRRLEAEDTGGEGPSRLVIVANSPAQLAERAQRARAHLQAGAPPGPGVHFRPAPIEGEVAFVYAAAGSAYPGMGLGLLRRLPELAQGLAVAAPGLTHLMDPVYRQPPRALTANEFLWATSALSQFHTAFSRELLELEPQAMVGYSSGETNSLFGGGAWRDFEEMYAELEASGMMEREIAGSFDALARRWGGPAEWRMWNVRAPLAAVEELVATEPRAHVAIVNTANDCVIAGEQAAVAAVAARIGKDRARELDYRCVCHVPEVEEVSDLWLRVHTREVTPTPGIRYYANAYGAKYRPTREACAQALLAQAVAQIDFPATIEAAYADGVRVFVEHGPQHGCSRWIGEILDQRPHVAVALDGRKAGFDAPLDAAAALLAAGVGVRVDELERRLAPRRIAGEPRRPLELPARFPPIRLPPRSANNGQLAAATDRPLRPDVEPAAIHAELQPMPPAPPPAQQLAWLDGVTASPRSQAIAALFAAHSQTHLEVIEQLRDLHLRYLDAPRRRSGSGSAALLAPPVPAPAPVVAFDRAALEVHASGRISDIFGPLFAQQDGYERQVRMPEPPLLLADRVTRLDAEPGSLGLGTIWTETDVLADAWYLHDGYMPAGIMIEAGQADLMLISYLGIDFVNRGERVYRLLGCTLTYEDDLPAPGETLSYEIHVDGHAQHGATRLFFFHQDCTSAGRPRLTVRDGQAGFFSDEALAQSEGIVWRPEASEPAAGARVDPPAANPLRREFSREQVAAFAEGRPFDCFGPGFEFAQTHVRSPRIQSGERLFIDRVTDFDPAGGPWGRGYLRAEMDVEAGDWYFRGHFKNDPCMPGNFMFEATLQGMAFYLAALGYTLERDGWRFQPVKGEPFELKCRGQVTPASREMVCEVFVEETIDGPVPTLFADVLGAVDGLRAFHGHRIGLQLVPDWPLTSGPELRTLGGAASSAPGRVAAAGGVTFDYPALLSAAWGKPSDAFGESYRRFDGTRRTARLPGPPYHFMSRVVRIEGDPNRFAAGVEVEIEYDPPPDAWYFEANGTATTPFAVLLEAALQPCGWLACLIGSPLQVETDVLFRNLDGTGVVKGELRPGDGPLRTVTRLTNLSRSGGMILTTFGVECLLADRVVYELDTVFGFFPPSAFEHQPGLTTSAEQSAMLAEPCDFTLDLGRREGPAFAPSSPRLAGPMLLMVDRITGFWPDGGSAGQGRVRGEMDVDPASWFFKAHFFQDPVQPGSLGLEALLQLLQWYMVHTGLTGELENARFEPIALDITHTWKYRGQVIPSNRLVTTTIDITAIEHEDRAVRAACDGSLWVDGKRIYEVTGMTMRAVSS